MRYEVFVTPPEPRMEPDGLHLKVDVLEVEADRYELQEDGAAWFYIGDEMIGGFQVGEFFGISEPGLTGVTIEGVKPTP